MTRGSSATRRFMKQLVTTVLVGAAALTTLAVASSAEAEPRYGNRESFWQGQLGLRSTFVTDPGFDPFAKDNSLTSASLGASRTVFAQDEISLATGVLWDYGTRGARARGQETNLEAHRLALALEGRYHFAPFVYGRVRLTPGAIYQSASLTDSLASAKLVASDWAFAFDASAGLAFLLGPHSESTASPVRWWLAGEGGYGYAGSTALRMQPDFGGDDPRRTGYLDLGRLALSGAFFRVYGSVTF
jgi:hypothetical protein